MVKTWLEKKNYKQKIVFNTEEIKRILPHRDPFLFLDRILELDPGRSVIAIKDVTGEEEFFKGHFPGQPIMPGVLVLEAMAQAGGFLLLHMVEDPTKKLMYFSTIERAKFRKQVVPGDQLRFELNLLKVRLGSSKISGKAYVNGEVVAEMTFLATLADRKVDK